MKTTSLLLHTSNTRRTLGVYLVTDGNNQLQRKSPTLETHIWADNTRAAHLDRTAAWLNITTTLIRQVYYTLLATTLSEKQCNKFMKSCLTDGMAAAGYNQSFLRAIIIIITH